MRKNLEILLEVQALEQRLKEVEAEIALLPRRIAAIEAKLAAGQQNLNRVKASQIANQGERRQVELQIETLRAKIVKTKSHSAEVKTNQEYRALLDEVAFAETEIGRHEERVLQIMEEAEGLDRDLRALDAELATQREQVRAETSQAAEKTAADKAESKTLHGRRDKLRAQVEEAWLVRFDRVMRARGHALASIERDACGSCQMRLRPQFLQEVAAQPDRMFACESCGRILYFTLTQPAETTHV